MQNLYAKSNPDNGCCSTCHALMRFIYLFFNWGPPILPFFILLLSFLLFLSFFILDSYGLCFFTFLSFCYLIIIYVPLFGLISELQFCHLSFDWRVVIFLCLIYSCPLSFCFCQLAVHLANYLVLLQQKNYTLAPPPLLRTLWEEMKQCETAVGTFLLIRRPLIQAS